jgi:hypothetical protein
MPVPQYIPFRQKQKPVSLRDVTGGMSPSEVIFEVERGARFIFFDYTISAIIVSYRRNSPVFFLKPGESVTRKGLLYALLSLLFGWWSFPSGLVSTPAAIARTLRGGHDITAKVLANTKAHMSKMTIPSTRTPA